jgi:hypothetical protein
MLERSPQPTMVIVLKSHKTEGLEYPVVDVSHRAQDFCHPVDWSGLRLEGNFDKVTLPQRLGQAEQSARGGNGLQFGFCAAAIFETNRSQYRIS